jgi:hypothetical protein
MDLGPVLHLVHSFLPRHELSSLEGASQRLAGCSGFDRREVLSIRAASIDADAVGETQRGERTAPTVIETPSELRSGYVHRPDPIASPRWAGSGAPSTADISLTGGVAPSLQAPASCASNSLHARRPHRRPDERGGEEPRRQPGWAGRAVARYLQARGWQPRPRPRRAPVQAGPVTRPRSRWGRSRPPGIVRASMTCPSTAEHHPGHRQDRRTRGAPPS